MFILFDHRIVLFLLLLSTTSMSDSAALSTTTNVRTSNTATDTNTRAGTRSHRSRKLFEGQNYKDWQMVITSDKLRANTYANLYKRTVGMVPSICDGNLKHILTALNNSKDFKFV